MIMLLLIILLVLAIFGGLPNIGPWPNHPYGYYPSGLLGVILVVLLIVLLLRAI